jgi:hypothetical protein
MAAHYRNRTFRQALPRVTGLLATHSRRMRPTVLREGPWRLYFFSREERRPHVHVQHPDGEAKFWLEPTVARAENAGLSKRQVWAAKAIVERHADEILRIWKACFPG